MDTTCKNNLHCDVCGRSIENKGYLSIDGWIICGICQWRQSQIPYIKPEKETTFPQSPNIC